MTEPDPAMLAFIAASMATGASRVRNVFGLCATAASAKLIPIVRVIRHMLFPSGQVKHSIAETR